MAREQIKTQYSGWQNWIIVENRGFSKNRAGKLPLAKYYCTKPTLAYNIGHLTCWLSNPIP